MKSIYRFSTFFAMISAFLLLCSCSDGTEHTVSEIPSLNVHCAENTVEADITSYSISTDSTTIQADGLHPLSVEYSDYLPTAQDAEIILEFPSASEPDSVSVRCWKDIYAGDETNAEKNQIAIENDGLSFVITNEGYYIYEVIAEWDNAQAHYGFKTGGMNK